MDSRRLPTSAQVAHGKGGDPHLGRCAWVSSISRRLRPAPSTTERCRRRRVGGCRCRWAALRRAASDHAPPEPDHTRARNRTAPPRYGSGRRHPSLRRTAERAALALPEGQTRPRRPLPRPVERSLSTTTPAPSSCSPPTPTQTARVLASARLSARGRSPAPAARPPDLKPPTYSNRRPPPARQRAAPFTPTPGEVAR